MDSKQKHYAEISAAKGILIILMVIGHSGVPSIIGEPLSLLRMPCFFMISGYLFKEKYLNDTKQFVYKKVKGLYFPFVKWSLIFMLLHNFFYHIHIYNTEYTFNNVLSKTLQILTMTGSEQLTGGFWFLKELLYASIISYFIFKLLNALRIRLNLKTLISSSLLLVILAYILSIITFKLPTVGSKTLSATAYFITGATFHRAELLFTNINKLKTGIVLFVIFVISSFYVKGSIECQGYTIFQYYVVSVIASISLIYLTKLLGHKLMNILDYVGKRTLYILIFHFISFKLVSLAVIIIDKREFSELASFPVIENDSNIIWLVYTIVGVLVPLFFKWGMDNVSSVYNKYCHFKKLQ